MAPRKKLGKRKDPKAGSLRNGWTLMDWTTGTRSSLPGYNHSCPEEKQMLMTPRLMTGSATDVDEQDPSALEAPPEPEPSKRSRAHVKASYSEADAATHVVDLAEGAPGAVPEVQAASSPDHGSADSEGQELSEHEFADEEEEDVVLLWEPTVPKRKKKNVKGPLWSDCRFGDVVPMEFPGGPKDKDVLSSYGSHIARYVYEGFDRVELTPISHGRKLRVFNQKLPNEA
ncbi:hypothetical protein QL285_052383 [Trifolium repens]|nr:hypothetical protein QL285_052383 [Trifolium repens]